MLEEINKKINTIQGGEIVDLHIHNNMAVLNLATYETMDKIELSFNPTSDETKHIPTGASDGQVIGKKNGSIEWIDQPTNTGGGPGTVPTKLSQLENDTGFITNTNLEGKVDKIAGKGLSSNDFTNENKLKLDGVPKFIFSTEVPTSLDENSICFVYVLLMETALKNKINLGTKRLENYKTMGML